jgi:hypothetical protein
MKTIFRATFSLTFQSGQFESAAAFQQFSTIQKQKTLNSHNQFMNKAGEEKLIETTIV